MKKIFKGIFYFSLMVWISAYFSLLLPKLGSNQSFFMTIFLMLLFQWIFYYLYDYHPFIKKKAENYIEEIQKGEKLDDREHQEMIKAWKRLIADAKTPEEKKAVAEALAEACQGKPLRDN